MSKRPHLDDSGLEAQRQALTEALARLNREAEARNAAPPSVEGSHPTQAANANGFQNGSQSRPAVPVFLQQESAARPLEPVMVTPTVTTSTAISAQQAIESANPAVSQIFHSTPASHTTPASNLSARPTSYAPFANPAMSPVMLSTPVTHTTPASSLPAMPTSYLPIGTRQQEASFRGQGRGRGRGRNEIRGRLFTVMVRRRHDMPSVHPIRCVKHLLGKAP